MAVKSPNKSLLRILSMKPKKFTITMILALIAMPLIAGVHHAGMNHAAMQPSNSKVVLTEAGMDAFATLQEVIVALEVNPNTHWEKVNMEALRLHLIQMQDMTLNVDVVQSNIEKGFQAVVTPTTARASQSLAQVLSAHPAQMKKETGWDMQVRNNKGVFTLTIITDKPQEVAKIRGLGYIGIMAHGKHHQPHHWAIASGDNPHAEPNIRH